MMGTIKIPCNEMEEIKLSPVFSVKKKRSGKDKSNSRRKIWNFKSLWVEDGGQFFNNEKKVPNLAQNLVEDL